MASSNWNQVEVPVILNSMQAETGINTTAVMEGMTAPYDDLATMYFSDVPETSLQLTLGGSYVDPQLPKALQLLPPTPVAARPLGGGGRGSQLHLALPSSPPPVRVSRKERIRNNRMKTKRRVMQKKLMRNGANSSAIINSDGARQEYNPVVMPPPPPPAAQPVAFNPTITLNGDQIPGLAQRNMASANGKTIVLGNASPIPMPTPVSMMIPVPGRHIPAPPVSITEPNERPAMSIGENSQNRTLGGAPEAKRATRADCNMVEIGGGMLKMMRMVTTTGGIPNGRRIEGVMYNRNNWQGCIVCVCHGKFLTPAEFVKHAGGVNVDEPLKYIYVMSN